MEVVAVLTMSSHRLEGIVLETDKYFTSFITLSILKKVCCFQFL